MITIIKDQTNKPRLVVECHANTGWQGDTIREAVEAVAQLNTGDSFQTISAMLLSEGFNVMAFQEISCPPYKTLGQRTRPE